MKKLFLMLALNLTLAFNAHASLCPDLYPVQIEPPKLDNTVELCNSFFVSIFDTNNKAVIAVSEKLENNTPVGSAKRINSFRQDTRVKGPKPGDYLNSGYDKGHMAPAQDASSPDQMRETFLMTNMTPQEPTLNEQAWKNLEESVRKKFAKVHANMYVVNIAIYHPKTKRIGSGIPVPIGYWKIVYAPGETRYYYATNTPFAIVNEVPAVDVNKLIRNAQNF